MGIIEVGWGWRFFCSEFTVVKHDGFSSKGTIFVRKALYVLYGVPLNQRRFSTSLSLWLVTYQHPLALSVRKASMRRIMHRAGHWHSIVLAVVIDWQ